MKNTFEDGSETSEVKRQLEHSQRLLRSFTSAFDALFDDNGQSDFMDRILKVINEQFDASYTLYLRFEPEKHAFFIDRVYAPGHCVPTIDKKKNNTR